jgi:hypothetical protein
MGNTAAYFNVHPSFVSAPILHNSEKLFYYHLTCFAILKIIPVIALFLRPIKKQNYKKLAYESTIFILAAHE